MVETTEAFHVPLLEYVQMPADQNLPCLRSAEEILPLLLLSPRRRHSGRASIRPRITSRLSFRVPQGAASQPDRADFPGRSLRLFPDHGQFVRDPRDPLKSRRSAFAGDPPGSGRPGVPIVAETSAETDPPT